VLARQLRSPLLVLLAVTALASAFVGQASDAVIIGTILVASVGLGFANEYKAEKAAEALHSSIRHRCLVLRDGHARTTDVTDLIAATTVFARVSPEHKAQVVRAQRRTGTDVAFLGDGVNDAVALHAADVGISVDSATDVAKDAARSARYSTSSRSASCCGDSTPDRHCSAPAGSWNPWPPRPWSFFAIRTRRIPFFRSRPSLPLTLAALAVVTVGAALPASPFGRMLGFQPLPGLFFLALVLMVVAYLLPKDLRHRDLGP
jgi:hypothetical protein